MNMNDPKGSAPTAELEARVVASKAASTSDGPNIGQTRDLA